MVTDMFWHEDGWMWDESREGQVEKQTLRRCRSSKEKAAPVHQRSAEEWASHCTQLLRGLADAMFASTKRFRSAVELVNGLEPKPLMKILGRLLAALPDKVRAKSIVTVDPFFARAFCLCACVV